MKLDSTIRGYNYNRLALGTLSRPCRSLLLNIPKLRGPYNYFVFWFISIVPRRQRRHPSRLFGGGACPISVCGTADELCRWCWAIPTAKPQTTEVARLYYSAWWSLISNWNVTFTVNKSRQVTVEFWNWFLTCHPSFDATIWTKYLELQIFDLFSGKHLQLSLVQRIPFGWEWWENNIKKI